MGERDFCPPQLPPAAAASNLRHCTLQYWGGERREEKRKEMLGIDQRTRTRGGLTVQCVQCEGKALLMPFSLRHVLRPLEFAEWL